MAKEISDSSFLCLCVREVLDFLIGDFNLPTTIEEDTAVFDLSHKNYHDEPFNLPYLKGAEIDNLSSLVLKHLYAMNLAAVGGQECKP